MSLIKEILTAIAFMTWVAATIALVVFAVISAAESAWLCSIITGFGYVISLSALYAVATRGL